MTAKSKIKKIKTIFSNNSQSWMMFSILFSAQSNLRLELAKKRYK